MGKILFYTSYPIFTYYENETINIAKHCLVLKTIVIAIITVNGRMVLKWMCIQSCSEWNDTSTLYIIWIHWGTDSAALVQFCKKNDHHRKNLLCTPWVELYNEEYLHNWALMKDSQDQDCSNTCKLTKENNLLNYFSA